MNVVALRRVALLLFGLGFLCIEAEIPVQPNFDTQKFSGQWYPLSAVQNKERKSKYVYSAPVFEFQPKERLIWTIEFPRAGTKCKKKIFYLTQLDRPGKYKTGSDNIYRFVETDYSSYFILHRETKNHLFMGLFGRAKEASDQVKEKFKKQASSLGFPADKIAPIQLKEQCAEPKVYIT